MDITERKIFEKKLTEPFLDVGFLNAGVYFLKITINGEDHFVRIVRE